jgi:hypothetical protein
MWAGKVLKRICSWCHQEMGIGLEAWPGVDHVITHGICEACAAGVLADLDTVEVYLPERHLKRKLSQRNSPLKPLDLLRPN